jgi:aminopeptidase N
MGINERKYAWMDEGWAALFGEYVVIDMGYDPSEGALNNTYAYSTQSAFSLNIPLMVNSTNLSFSSMSNYYYSKSSQANKFLFEYLESVGIEDSYKEYIRRWNGKHPVPYDFFFTMEDLAGEDLSWFWNPWYFEFGYPDLGIGEVQSGEGVDIIVIMKGKQPVPVDLKITFDDDSTEEIYQAVGVWKELKGKAKFHLDTRKKVKKVELGNNGIPDVNQENNVWESK